MDIAFTRSFKLLDQWIEKTIPFVYHYPQIFEEGDEPRPVSFQQYERLWVWAPRPPMLDEDVTEIGIIIHQTWVNTYDGNKKNNDPGFFWRASVPYHVHNSKHNSSCGMNATLEGAMQDSENWIVSYLGIK